MTRSWRIIVVLCILAAAVSAGTVSYLEGQLSLPRVIQSPGTTIVSCTPPANASSSCIRCYQSFCKNFPTERTAQLCQAFCGTATASSTAMTISSRPAVFVSSATSTRFSARSSAPVCGNAICEATEAQYCPRDCPDVSPSSPSAASSAFSNPLQLSCDTLPNGMDGCSACLRALCPVLPEQQVIDACYMTCRLIHGTSSSSAAQSSSVYSQTSSSGEPGSAFIEIRTTNAQMFQTSGEGWVSYGVSRMHKNTIAPNDGQATASWQTQLPFGEYSLYMYWPHNDQASEQFLMDRVPMSVNLNTTNFPIIVNQRNPPVAFTETIGGAGPETVDHNWYFLGTFKAVAVNGYEQPQTVRLFLSTGRATDSIKKPADGWVAAGDLRIYYKTPGIECGDGKCHDTERDSCSIDCDGVPQCGNGYCDVRSGETLQTCVADCGQSGVCGNLRCEPYAGETIGSCPSDCQTLPGTNGGEGGDGGGNSSSSAPSSQPISSQGTQLFCGDGKCSAEIDETQETCPLDCGQQSSAAFSAKSSITPVSSRASSAASTGTCGNARCDNGENYISCPKDCANRCGDGICNPTPGINPGENVTNCPADCSSCGDYLCTGSENYETCPKDCARTSSSSKSGSMSASSKQTVAVTPCSLTDINGVTCYDSDCRNNSGLQPQIPGKVTDSNVYLNPPTVLNDICTSNTLREAVCVWDPLYVNRYYQIKYMDVTCPYGCANGACKASPSGASMDEREPQDMLEEPMEEEPEPITLDEPIVEEPVVDEWVDMPVIEPEPVIDTPSCENRTGGTMCTLCFNAFCPFGSTRAQWLCSLYCISPELSAMVQPVSSDESSSVADEREDSGKDGGFWKWLQNFTASLVATLIEGLSAH